MRANRKSLKYEVENHAPRDIHSAKYYMAKYNRRMINVDN